MNQIQPAEEIGEELCRSDSVRRAPGLRLVLGGRVQLNEEVGANGADCTESTNARH